VSILLILIGACIVAALACCDRIDNSFRVRRPMRVDINKIKLSRTGQLLSADEDYDT